MQWQRFWRVILTGMILVGLWWWTTVSAGANGPMRNAAPSRPMPAGVRTSNFNACNPAAWWSFATVELSPCAAWAGQPVPAAARMRSSFIPR